MERVAGIWLGQLRSLLGVAELKVELSDHFLFKYLMKQLSVCVQKWRSTFLNHGLKYRTLDTKPAAPIRISNLPLSESNFFPAIIPGRTTAFSPILLPEEIPIDCEINNNDN